MTCRLAKKDKYWCDFVLCAGCANKRNTMFSNGEPLPKPLKEGEKSKVEEVSVSNGEPVPKPIEEGKESEVEQVSVSDATTKRMTRNR